MSRLVVRNLLQSTLLLCCAQQSDSSASVFERRGKSSDLPLVAHHLRQQKILDTDRRHVVILGQNTGIHLSSGQGWEGERKNRKMDDRWFLRLIQKSAIQIVSLFERPPCKIVVDVQLDQVHVQVTWQVFRKACLRLFYGCKYSKSRKLEESIHTV